MKFLIFVSPVEIAAFIFAGVLASTQGLAQNAYVPNAGSNTVSVIDTATNMVIGSPIPVGSVPIGVAVTPDRGKPPSKPPFGRPNNTNGRAYITNNCSNTVSVIDTEKNALVTAITVGPNPFGVAVTPDGGKVYVANSGSSGACGPGSTPFPPNTVTVIDASTNTVIGPPIPVGTIPFGIAVNPDGRKVYVTNFLSNSVSVIDRATNTVTSSFSVSEPHGVAVSKDGSKLYVASSSNSLFVIDATTNTITATIPAGFNPLGVVMTPDGSKIYITNNADNVDTVSVVDTSTNTAIATITVGFGPFGLAVTPDGRKVYVANSTGNSAGIPNPSTPSTVSVIDTARDKVTATIPVGVNPSAFGNFIQPAPRFAATPGDANCYGKSLSVLVGQYYGLNLAAAELGFSSLRELQEAILAFCD